MDVFFSIFIFSIPYFFQSTESRIINGSKLRSLRCLGIKTDENCRLLGGPPIPERLVELYEQQIRKVRDAFDYGSLGGLSKYELITVHPVLILLLPVDALSELNGDKLAHLLEYWAENGALILHIVQAASVSFNKVDFLMKLQGVYIPEENLNLIGQKIVDWEKIMYHGLVTVGNPLLAHLPLTFLYNMKDSERNQQLFYLRIWFKSGEGNWSMKSKIIQRVWADAMIKADFPLTLSSWSNIELEKMGKALVGLTPHELERLERTNFGDGSDLFFYNLTSLQVRVIFRKFYSNLPLDEEDFNKLIPILNQLTPLDLQMFQNKVTNFRNLKSQPGVKSITTAKQIVEYLVIESLETGKVGLNTTSWKGSSIKHIGKFIYCLGLSSLQYYRNSPLPMDQIISLQSEYLTPAQVFYLTGNGSTLDPENPFSLYSYLHGLSTSKFPQGNLLPGSRVIYYLLKHMPLNNLPRTVSFLNKIWSFGSNNEILKHILKNPARNNLLELIHSRHISKNAQEFVSSLLNNSEDMKNQVNPLPDLFASSLYRSPKVIELVQVLKAKYVREKILISGVTCEDIDYDPTPDFIYKMSQFNKLLKEQNKKFPKDLQECCVRKLIEYLKLKAGLVQQYMQNTLIDLLTEVEIEAVGGFVLSYLTMEDIKASGLSKKIIKSIGRLSLVELLEAAPLTKLRGIIQLYRKIYNNQLGAEALFNLGNLTLLSSEETIRTIDTSAFKVILEGKYLDQRLCADSRERHAWADLIQSSLGSISSWTSHELEVLGDMLIVFPEESLRKINESAWLDVADLLHSGYGEVIHRVPKIYKFYEVCELRLPQLENKKYIHSVKKLVTFFLKAAQLQSNSVKTAVELLKPDIVYTKIPNEFVLEEEHKVSKLNRDISKPKLEVTVTDMSWKEESTALHTEEPKTNFLQTGTDSWTTISSIAGDYDNQRETNNKVTTVHTELYSGFLTDLGLSSHDPIHTFEVSSTESVMGFDSSDNLVEESVIDQMGASVVYEHTTELTTEKETTLVSTVNRNFQVVSTNSEPSSDRKFHLTGKISNDTNESYTTEWVYQALKGIPVFIETRFQNMSETFIDISDEHSNEPLEVDFLTAVQKTLEKAKKRHEVRDVSEEDLEDNLLIPGADCRIKRTIISPSLTFSCDAFKIVGTIAEIIISEDIVKHISDRDLQDCMETFGEMDLPLSIQKLMWNRLGTGDIHLKGKLVSAAEISDFETVTLKSTIPWILESISVISLYNHNSLLANFIARKVVMEDNMDIEMIAALGKLLCLVPKEVVRDKVDSRVMRRVSVLLGRRLPCQPTCLQTFTSLAQEAFAPSISWTSLDFHSFGILVAGLDHQEWKLLLKSNERVLYGLQMSAALCLSDNHLKAIPVKMISTIPTSVRDYLREKRLHSFNKEQKQALTSAQIRANDLQYSSSTRISPIIILIFVCYLF